ncbi:glutathione S-transferase [Pseudomonas sp. URIL14HWK12:I12]|uniref:glutathione S-transferase n=2 Tax=unclassified Pseudomonas TaxID=196821 RepID=UPI000BD9A6F6|nr:glutathione S-transferase [Pseudomonas sp. URIL14HWK12:I12]PVZ21938.1 glutathione S-transferase [Pseudomonas sp. URIL14HWK12:I10]PVZ30979.1 glutathione S-transferase [Pseudomonas sp. URIL14HWK12:I11]SNZ17470.1 Glutathione S-transferase [Pseudomonas sp. URIL14HWK12:I9]
MSSTQKSGLGETSPVMKLHWSPRSPFVRKVMIVLHETGQLDLVECVRNVVGMAQPNEQVMLDNPLNKIPTLVLPDGQALYDSRVICEYLDGLHSGDRLVPRGGSGYYQAMTWQALGDGFLDLLLLWRNWATDRGLAHDAPDDAYMKAFSSKTERALNALESQAEQLQAAALNIGHIAIACALGHLDFRWECLQWRNGRPRLAAWFKAFNERPSAQATLVRNDEATAAH